MLGINLDDVMNESEVIKLDLFIQNIGALSNQCQEFFLAWRCPLN